MDPHGELVDGHKLDYHQIVLPIPENKTYGFMIRLENTKVLFDTDDIGQNLIIKNDLDLKKGNSFTQAEKESRYAFLVSALNGIADYADTPLILFDKKIDFYTRAIPAWFRFLKSEYQPSGYIAFPRIEKEDPKFFGLVQSFVSATEAEELVALGNQIIAHLFPKL